LINIYLKPSIKAINYQRVFPHRVTPTTINAALFCGVREDFTKLTAKKSITKGLILTQQANNENPF
jgi:hypothetical protein